MNTFRWPRSTSRRVLGLITLLALAGQQLSAQTASSTNYTVQGVVLDATGGGAASLDHWGWVSLGALAGSGFASESHSASLGLLAGPEPDPGDLPVIFSVLPSFGPADSNTFVRLSGINFNKFGSGPTVDVLLNTLHAGAVNVLSNTRLECWTPSGPFGPQNVTLTSSLGAASLRDGFINTPAIISSDRAMLGATMVIRNYGPFGGGFRTFASVFTTNAPTAFGTLLIGPFPLVDLIPPTPYAGHDGISTHTFLLPNDPVLEGLTLWVQSLNLTQLSPVQGELTNASSTIFQ